MDARRPAPEPRPADRPAARLDRGPRGRSLLAALIAAPTLAIVGRDRAAPAGRPSRSRRAARRSSRRSSRRIALGSGLPVGPAATPGWRAIGLPAVVGAIALVILTRVVRLPRAAGLRGEPGLRTLGRDPHRPDLARPGLHRRPARRGLGPRAVDRGRGGRRLRAARGVAAGAPRPVSPGGSRSGGRTGRSPTATGRSSSTAGRRSRPRPARGRRARTSWADAAHSASLDEPARGWRAGPCSADLDLSGRTGHCGSPDAAIGWRLGRRRRRQRAVDRLGRRPGWRPGRRSATSAARSGPRAAAPGRDRGCGGWPGPPARRRPARARGERRARAAVARLGSGALRPARAPARAARRRPARAPARRRRARVRRRPGSGSGRPRRLGCGLAAAGRGDRRRPSGARASSAGRRGFGGHRFAALLGLGASSSASKPRARRRCSVPVGTGASRSEVRVGSPALRRRRGLVHVDRGRAPSTGVARSGAVAPLGRAGLDRRRDRLGSSSRAIRARRRWPRPRRRRRASDARVDAARRGPSVGSAARRRSPEEERSGAGPPRPSESARALRRQPRRRCGLGRAACARRSERGGRSTGGPQRPRRCAHGRLGTWTVRPDAVAGAAAAGRPPARPRPRSRTGSKGACVRERRREDLVAEVRGARQAAALGVVPAVAARVLAAGHAEVERRVEGVELLARSARAPRRCEPRPSPRRATCRRS